MRNVTAWIATIKKWNPSKFQEQTQWTPQGLFSWKRRSSLAGFCGLIISKTQAIKFAWISGITFNHDNYRVLLINEWKYIWVRISLRLHEGEVVASIDPGHEEVSIRKIPLDVRRVENSKIISHVHCFFVVVAGLAPRRMTSSFVNYLTFLRDLVEWVSPSIVFVFLIRDLDTLFRFTFKKNDKQRFKLLFVLGHNFLKMRAHRVVTHLMQKWRTESSEFGEI